MALSPAQLSGAKLGTGRTYIGTDATRQALLRQFGGGSMVRDPKTGKMFFKGTLGGATPPPTAGTPAAPAAPTADSITQSFIDSIKGLLPKQATPVTPFDQSGFYNEADAQGAVNAEYDPWAARQKAYQDQLNSEQDRQTAEQVNAAGGLKSSAYQNDMALRQEALKRAAEDQANQVKAQKDTSLLARRNEAYQRYLQGIGGATA
jgi:hypothetical protein